MLNLLISILGDSYDRFQMNQIQFDYEQRVEFVLEVLRVRSFLYRNIGSIGGKFLHVCISSEKNLEQNDENWEGKLRYMESKRDKDSQILKEKVENIEKIMKQKVDRVEINMNVLQKKVDSMDSKIETILKNLVSRK